MSQGGDLTKVYQYQQLQQLLTRFNQYSVDPKLGELDSIISEYDPQDSGLHGMILEKISRHNHDFDVASTNSCYTGVERNIKFSTPISDIISAVKYVMKTIKPKALPPISINVNQKIESVANRAINKGLSIKFKPGIKLIDGTKLQTVTITTLNQETQRKITYSRTLTVNEAKLFKSNPKKLKDQFKKEFKNHNDEYFAAGINVQQKDPNISYRIFNSSLNKIELAQKELNGKNKKGYKDIRTLKTFVNKLNDSKTQNSSFKNRKSI